MYVQYVCRFYINNRLALNDLLFENKPFSNKKSIKDSFAELKKLKNISNHMLK